MPLILIGLLAGPNLEAQQAQAVDARFPRESLVKPAPAAEVNADRPASPDLLTAYTFSSATETIALEDMSSGTTQLVAANLDDTASPVTPIGFDFLYDGVRFTQFSVNANGLCRLGASAVSTDFDNGTGFASTANAPKIAPYFDDLWVGTNGKVHYKIVGSYPDRKLVIEWLNMQIPRIDAGSPGAGTFQLWLTESSGAINFVYGPGIAVNNANGGYSIGVQSGAAANFMSVTSAGAAVSWTVANNTQTTAIAPGTFYGFQAQGTAPPSNLSFTAVTPTGMTLNWTDNAANEIGFLVYESTDNTNFTFVGQTPANATSLAVIDLVPTTTYFWRVMAMTAGAMSAALTGSHATTTTPGNVATAGSGAWSNPATWIGGVVPTLADAVTVTTGNGVTIDTQASAYSLTVQTGALVQFDTTIPRALTVAQSLSIAFGGALHTPPVGSVTTHVVSVGGNLVNDGELDLSTNANTVGASLIFTGAASATFSGSGAVTDVRTITVNKGTSSASVLEVMPLHFTVMGAATDVAGFLTLTNGTLKISGTFFMMNRVFTTPAYTIPATCGIWLNNPTFFIAGTASGTTTVNNGLFRVTQGTYNIGIGPADEMGGGANAVFIIEGGTVNAAGRIDPQSAVSYTQTGGTVNVGVVGNNRNSFGSFEIFDSASSFTMSGGTINIVNHSTAAAPVDYDVRTFTINVTGGQLVVGAPGAPPGTTYQVYGSTPSLTVNPTITMVVNTNVPLFMRGTALVNNGAIVSGATGTPRFDFASAMPTTYSGSGTFGSAATPFDGFGISSNTTAPITLNAPIYTNRVNLFQGGFVHSNQITLGSGGGSTTVVQIGSTGLTTPGGSFDVSPVHNAGTGGEIVIYAFETAPRVTGLEINPSRILTSLGVNNPNNVTIAGGDLTLSGTATALTLASGRVITNANTLKLAASTATVTRTGGRVDGNLQKTYAAAQSKAFEVGTANGYSPVTVATTAGTFPATVTVTAVQGAFPALGSPQFALQRYWTLTAGNVTADLTFNYLDPTDIPGTANEGTFSIFKYDGALTQPGGVVNAAGNTATITGVSSFSSWTLASSSAVVFTDQPLSAGTPIKAVHVTELRAAIDAARYRHGLGPFSYTEAVSAGTVIKASHVLQMRTALNDAYAAASLPPFSYSRTPAIGLVVQIGDITEMRTAVLNIP